MAALLGVNLPYLDGAYGHDLAPSARWPDWPCSFRLPQSWQPLLEARQLGFQAVRIWLCEGGEGLLLDARGHLVGPHPQLLDSLRALEAGAATAGLRVYWTLLDANAAARDGDPITRALLSDPDGAARLADRLVAPVVRAMDPQVTMGLEVINEPEVLTEDCRDAPGLQGGPTVSWEVLARVVELATGAARAERPALIVTAGTGHVFLPKLWRSGARPGAVDLHVYHAGGGLPSREDLCRYVGDPTLADPALPLLAGECGIPKDGPPDEPYALRNYLYNADTRGYAAAFLWKLEGDLVDAGQPGRPWTALGHEVRRVLASRPAGGFRP